MKILHFDYDDLKNPSTGGGQAKATYQINKRLISLGNVVTVYTGKYKNSKKEIIDGIEYKRIGIGFLGITISILSYWIFIPFIILLNQHKYDLIVEFFTVPFSASFAPFVAKKPLIACPSFFNARELSAKYKIPFYLFEEFGVKHYKAFIALTNASREKILKINSNANIIIIPRGIEKSFLESQPEVGNYILFLGRIDIFQKGIDLLVDAFSNSFKANPNINLVIAGNGSDKDINYLKTQIKNFNGENNVQFIGRIDGQSKIDLLSKSMFVICPSRFENFGNVGLEAIACGKVLVCFDIGGFDYVNEPIVKKVLPYDINRLSNVILDLSNNIDLLKNLSIKSKEFAKDFDWDQIVDQYQKTYLKILE